MASRLHPGGDSVRASKYEQHVCPPDHGHDKTGHCYRNHRCRCDRCREFRRREYESTSRFYQRKRAMGGRTVFVDSGPSVRKMRALARLGWSAADVGAFVGLNGRTIGSFRSGAREFVRLETARKLDRAYKHFSGRMKDDRAGRTTVTLAKRSGWHHPFDWDDIEAGVLLEEPEEVVFDHAAVQLAIAGDRTGHRFTNAELDAVVRVLNVEQRWSDKRIAEVANTSKTRVSESRARQGIPMIPMDEQVALKEAA